MRPAIAGVAGDAIGPAVRANAHTQDELPAPLRCVVAGPGPGWGCKVKRDARCRDFLEPDTGDACQLCQKAAIGRKDRCELGRWRLYRWSEHVEYDGASPMLLGQQTQFADRPVTTKVVVPAGERAAQAVGDVRQARASRHTSAPIRLQIEPVLAISGSIAFVLRRVDESATAPRLLVFFPSSAHRSVTGRSWTNKDGGTA